MSIAIETLPDSPDDLKGIVVDLSEENAAWQVRFDKETAILQEQIKLLRAQLYGRKSEKVIPEGGPEPLSLFDMPEPDIDEDGQEEEIHVPAHNRRKKGRKPLPDNLPRVEEVHDIAEEDKICGCGCELKRIGEETSEKLDIIPAKIQVIRHIRPKYACPECEGVKDDGPTVKIAPVHPQIIPKSIVSPGLLAYILTGKFIDHTPFYRQEKQLVRLGVAVSRASMCNWAMQAAEACHPLLNLLQDEIIEGPVVNIDETPVQVLREPGRRPTDKSYMWVFRRGDPQKPILIYQYHPSRKGDVADAVRNFEGTVQTDGYSGYNFFNSRENVLHIGCWAHVRRKFTDVIKTQGKNRKTGAADKALSFIRKLYALEREARDNEYSPEQILTMRREKARPIIGSFEKWLSRKKLQTPPKGLLGKAISYTFNQWDRLIGYLEDGRAAIDNNMAENAIRPFVVGRKNWLFSGTPKGAEASALLYSLIETAKANKLEPYAYLRYIFEKLPIATSVEDYEALLPWNVTPALIGSPRIVGCG